MSIREAKRVYRSRSALAKRVSVRSTGFPGMTLRLLALLQPAGCQQSLTGQPARILGRQENCNRRDVIRLPNAAERVWVSNCFWKSLPMNLSRIGAFCLHHAGIDRVNADL